MPKPTMKEFLASHGFTWERLEDGPEAGVGFVRRMKDQQNNRWEFWIIPSDPVDFNAPALGQGYMTLSAYKNGYGWEDTEDTTLLEAVDLLGGYIVDGKLTDVEG